MRIPCNMHSMHKFKVQRFKKSTLLRVLWIFIETVRIDLTQARRNGSFIIQAEQPLWNLFRDFELYGNAYWSPISIRCDPWSVINQTSLQYLCRRLSITKRQILQCKNIAFAINWDWLWNVYYMKLNFTQSRKRKRNQSCSVTLCLLWKLFSHFDRHTGGYICFDSNRRVKICQGKLSMVAFGTSYWSCTYYYLVYSHFSALSIYYT